LEVAYLAKPYLQAKPVRPTFFLQEAQRFFLTFFPSFASSSTGSTVATSALDSTAGTAAAPSTSEGWELSCWPITLGSSTETFRLESEVVVLAISSFASAELGSFLRKSL
jgi:hypothetical protein